jgi:hypothetical protein
MLVRSMPVAVRLCAAPVRVECTAERSFGQTSDCICEADCCYAIVAHIPVISGVAERSLVRKLTRQLARYGHAEFRTNAGAYRPAHT